MLRPGLARRAALRVGFLDDQAFRWGANRQANLELAHREGATVVRAIVEWAKVAPRRPRDSTDPFAPAYRLDDVDELVRNAHADGLDVLLTIWGTPGWANGGARENVAPRNPRDLRDFASALAARYSGRYPGLPFVRFYSAWNEPNSALFLSPQFDGIGRPVAPRVYARLAAAVYAGVKGASPAALVAAGETAARGHDRPVAGVHDGESPARFAELVAAAAPRLRFDAWAQHPYPATDLQLPDAPQPWPDVGLSSLGRFSAELARWFHRREVPIWVTEFGYRTSPQVARGAPYALQASYLEQAVMLARAQPHVEMFVWFRFRDVRGQAWASGVVDARGRPKPALASFAAAADCYRAAADPCLEQAKLSAGQAGSGVRSFGSGVALSADGDTALVGESGADAAWIFTRSGSHWQRGPRLVPDDEDGDARVGSSVALSANGRTAVVGGAADADGDGAVWVFVRSGDTWTEAGPKLVPDDETGGGRFGGTVAVSADGATVLAGAHDDDGGAGAVWLFAATAGSWAQQGPKLASPDGSGAAQFGSRVAVSADGETALVGAPADAGGRGAAWIFTRASAAWSEGVGLAPTAEAGAAAFGWSVALSADGSTALVGGPGEGGAWTFVRTGGAWLEQGPGLRPAAESGAGAFGTSVALSADGVTALVGAGNDAAGAGAAWIFGRSPDGWIEEAAKLAPADVSGVASIGSTAALSGDASTALLGGPGDSAYAGAAWVFTAPSNADLGP